MRSYTFHWELETILQQFCGALNTILIKRYNESRAVGDQIFANFVFSPKTRTLEDLVNKAQHHKLPVISVYPTSIQRDPNRVFTKIDGSYFADTTTPIPSAWIHLMQPVPVDVTVNVSILTRFQRDMDQILANFVPYIDPYFVVSWKWPDLIPWSDFEIRSHCIWNENISFQYPTDVVATDPYWCIADTSFVIQTWMFKNSPNPSGPIFVIDTSFTSVSAIEEYNVMKSIEEIGVNTDWFSDYTVISARPLLTNSNPYFTYMNQGARSFAIYGKMIDYTDKLFLSGNDWTIFNTTSTGEFLSGVQFFNMFAVSSFAASADYPGFSAVEFLSSYWAIESANVLNFTFTPQNTGRFDVIGLNGAGYGKLMVDSIRPTLNPYPSSFPEFLTYVEYQPPCVSGLEIKGL